MWSEPIEEWSDLRLGLDVALSVVDFGHFETHFHSLDQIIWLFFGSRIAQLREFFLAFFVKLDTLRNIERIGSEKTIDLLLEFGDVFLSEG